jgi:hypothetical protein
MQAAEGARSMALPTHAKRMPTLWLIVKESTCVAYALLQNGSMTPNAMPRVATRL